MTDLSGPKPTCVGCRFYIRKGSKCRRFPPVVIFDIGIVARVVMFPHVSDGMWCGEWSPTPEFASGAAESSQRQVTGASSRADISSSSQTLSPADRGGQTP